MKQEEEDAIVGCGVGCVVGLFLLFIVVAIITVVAAGAIWAGNTLFGLNIPLTAQSVFAVAILFLAIRFIMSK